MINMDSLTHNHSLILFRPKQLLRCFLSQFSIKKGRLKKGRLSLEFISFLFFLQMTMKIVEITKL